MAGRGPTRKSDAVRPRSPRFPRREIALAGTFAPAAPRGVRVKVRRWWDGFVASELARATLQDSDVPALERLALLYDERERIGPVIRREPMLADAKGPTLHPLMRRLHAVDGEIRQLEDRFGLSPRARLALGVQLGQARRSLEDLYRDLDTDPDAAAAPVVDLKDGASG